MGGIHFLKPSPILRTQSAPSPLPLSSQMNSHRTKPVPFLRSRATQRRHPSAFATDIDLRRIDEITEDNLPAHESAIHTIRVNKKSRDRPPGIVEVGECALASDGGRARSIEHSEGIAVSIAHEAVIHIVRVSIISRDRSRIVDATGKSALVSGSARARNIECGERAAGSAHEAVIQITRVNPVSGD